MFFFSHEKKIEISRGTMVSPYLSNDNHEAKQILKDKAIMKALTLLERKSKSYLTSSIEKFGDISFLYEVYSAKELINYVDSLFSITKMMRRSRFENNSPYTWFGNFTVNHGIAAIILI